MKYPFILFYRHDKYEYIDVVLKSNATNLNCTLHIINKKEQLNKFYKQIYPLLIIFGDTKEEYDVELEEFNTEQFHNRIIYMSSFIDVELFNSQANEYYINLCTLNRSLIRPVFSIFTTAFNSFDKILRAYNSIKTQTLTNWEWIIIDDSPNDQNFQFLKENLSEDNRIRLYRRHENNGYIGNVKNESISLCRGKYVIELDHDDEILPFVLQESTDLFETNLEVGFIYMDFINLYENGTNFWYGNHLCKGYGSYYCQKYNEQWVYVYNTPNINNITLSHLVCCPNHPRIWRKDVLLSVGNYCEYLPICDDYEILLRTAINTKMAKIHKMGYIQYMNNENNNFSLIRNAEINRIGPKYISPIFYSKFDIHNKMKELDAYEDEKYINNDHTVVWERQIKNPEYTHKYCNLIVNSTFETQYCIIGLDGLYKHLNKIKELYQNDKNDFIVLENKCDTDYLIKRIEWLGFNKMKCFSLMDIHKPTYIAEEMLINYFKMMYLSTNQYEILNANMERPLTYYNKFGERHDIINSGAFHSTNYLEIGIENGYTMTHVNIAHKVGVDPDPKTNIGEIYTMTSDEYFKQIKQDKNIIYDTIFIDGLHHCENVLRDFSNSINVLSDNGKIYIDDILPINYREQLKIPENHYFEKGVVKYKEEWTGDVWKFIYYLLKHYNDKILYSFYNHPNHRGVIAIAINPEINVKTFIDISEETYNIMNGYNYFEDFNDYVYLLNQHNCL